MTVAIEDRPALESESLVRTAGASIGFGLSASNWDEGLRIAKQLALSTLVPKAYQGHAEDIVVAMQYGAEVGLPPMAALQSIAVINGKPGLYGDGLLAVVMSARAYLKHEEYYVTVAGEQVKSLRVADLKQDETRAVSIFWRRGVPEPFVAEFSIADAKTAKLWTKAGPWSEYPARQLKWRARGFAARDGFAPELRGVKSAEELLDSTDLDDVIDAEARVVPPSPPVRRSAKVAEVPTQPAEPAAPAEDPFLESELPPAAETRADARTDMLEGLVITDTKYVPVKDADALYEIVARVDVKGQSPVAHKFVTRDKDVYDLAASCEGSTKHFAVSYHLVPDRPGKPDYKVIDELVAKA